MGKMVHHVQEMVRVAAGAFNEVQIGDGFDVLVFLVINLEAIHI